MITMTSGKLSVHVEPNAVTNQVQFFIFSSRFQKQIKHLTTSSQGI